MSSATFGITTYIEGTCPLGQWLARPLSVTFGRSFTADLDEFEPTLLEKISLAALAIVTLPLSLIAIGTGLVLLYFSKNHKEACERLVQDFAVSSLELKKQALKITSALAKYVAIFNHETRYGDGLGEIIDRIKRLYFAISQTDRQRDWRFWQEDLAKLCACYKLPCYDLRDGELTPLEPVSREAVQKALMAVRLPEGDQLRLDIAILLCKVKEIKTVEEVIAETAFLQPQVFKSLPYVGIVSNPVDCVARALLRTPRPSLTDAIVESLTKGVAEIRETLTSSKDDKDRSLAGNLMTLEEAPENERLLSQTVASLSDLRAKETLQHHLDEMRVCYLSKYTQTT